MQATVQNYTGAGIMLTGFMVVRDLFCLLHCREKREQLIFTVALPLLEFHPPPPLSFLTLSLSSVDAVKDYEYFIYNYS